MKSRTIAYLCAFTLWFSTSISSFSASLIPSLVQTDCQLMSPPAILSKWELLTLLSNIHLHCCGMVASICSKEAFGIGSIICTLCWLSQSINVSYWNKKGWITYVALRRCVVLPLSRVRDFFLPFMDLVSTLNSINIHRRAQVDTCTLRGAWIQ